MNSLLCGEIQLGRISRNILVQPFNIVGNKMKFSYNSIIPVSKVHQTEVVESFREKTLEFELRYGDYHNSLFNDQFLQSYSSLNTIDNSVSEKELIDMGINDFDVKLSSPSVEEIVSETPVLSSTMNFTDKNTKSKVSSTRKDVVEPSQSAPRDLSMKPNNKQSKTTVGKVSTTTTSSTNYVTDKKGITESAGAVSSSESVGKQTKLNTAKSALSTKKNGRKSSAEPVIEIVEETEQKEEEVVDFTLPLSPSYFPNYSYLSHADSLLLQSIDNYASLPSNFEISRRCSFRMCDTVTKSDFNRNSLKVYTFNINLSYFFLSCHQVFNL
jgi:hypothetical protein